MIKKYTNGSWETVDYYREYGTDSETYGAVPVTIYAAGEPLIELLISGNMNQQINLFDYKTVYASYIDNDGNINANSNNLSAWNYFPAELVGKTVTIRFYVSSIASSYVRVQGQIDSEYITGDAVSAGGTGYSSITVTPTSTSDRWRITYGSGVFNVVINQVMLNEGSTALPYVPYTPSPTTPIQPQECGERTRNLFDKTADYSVGQTTNNYTISGLDPDKYYTCSTNFEKEESVHVASVYFAGGNSGTNGVWKNYPKTFKPNAAGEILVYVRWKSTDGAPAIYDDVMAGTIWIMVNEGSTALPYEPYGYAITIEVN